MGVGSGLYMYDVVVKRSRSLSHILMSSFSKGGTIQSSATLPKSKQYSEMQHGSPVETSNVHRASQLYCRISSGIFSNNAALKAESKCYRIGCPT